MRKSKPETSTKPKFIPCGRCIGGLVRVERSPGHFVMRQCACMIAFKTGGKLVADLPPVDFKVRGAGEAA